MTPLFIRFLFFEGHFPPSLNIYIYISKKWTFCLRMGRVQETAKSGVPFLTSRSWNERFHEQKTLKTCPFMNGRDFRPFVFWASRSWKRLFVYEREPYCSWTGHVYERELTYIAIFFEGGQKKIFLAVGFLRPSKWANGNYINQF